MKKPKLIPETDICKCSKCGEFFKSTAAFDKHRVGGVCRTRDEMITSGMQLNRDKLWITKGITGQRWLDMYLLRK